MLWQSPDEVSVAREPALVGVDPPTVPSEPGRTLLEAPEAVAPRERPRPPNAIPNESIVRFDDAESMARYFEALERAGLKAYGQLPQLNAVRLPESTLRRLDPAAFGGREEPNFFASPPVPPSDFPPELLGQLRGFGLTAGEISGIFGENAGSGVRVAILDTGVDSEMGFPAELRLWRDYLGTDADARHGTSVASIISGPDGVAPASTLLSFRVLDEDGVGNSFDLARGIVDAVDSGAQIINLSVGVYGESPVLLEAIRYAHGARVLMVASAGNEAIERLPYPAADPRVLAVTAIDADSQHPLFPNQARGIDFAAPGVGIVVHDGTEVTLFSGTSAAAPMVSGTLAALISENPRMAPEGVVALMRQHLDDAGMPGPDPTYGEGILSWERLGRRAQGNVVDLAIADIHVPANAVPGQTTAIQVVVQNRGTAWLSNATLKIRTNEGGEQTFSLGSLDPGAVAARAIYVTMPDGIGSSEVDILAQVTPPAGSEDVDLSNNLRVRRISRSPVEN